MLTTTSPEALRPTVASARLAIDLPDDVDALWQTLLFTPPATPPAPRRGMSPRHTFQLALHARAVIVDRRPAEQRAVEGEIDPTLPVVTDLEAAEHADAATIVVIGVEPTSTDGRQVVALDGGVTAWAAAGLPMASPALRAAA